MTEKQLQKLAHERERIESLMVYEKEYGHMGLVCGIDEVGRGPLAGPVVACACILPEEEILYINDSKKLSSKKREELYGILTDKAIYGIGIIDNERIDEINILNATYEAMRMAIEKLSKKPSVLLNDAVTIPEVDIMQVPIIKGDAKSVSIGAASIIAKVYRDNLMDEYAKIYPEYAFESNKGYGTKAHTEAILKYGLTPIHRRSFCTKYGEC